MATFAEIKGHNLRLIRKALAGVVFAKRWAADDDPIEQVWTNAGGLMVPAGYQSVGATSKDDAVTNSRDIETSEVTSWGYGEPTRVDITTDTSTLQFTMQESKRLVLELYNQADYSSVAPDSDGNIVLDKPSIPEVLEWRIFTLSKDGDGPNAIYFMRWYPYCRITSVEDLEETEGSERRYTVTASGFQDPAALTAVREIWGGPGLPLDAMGFPTTP